MVLVTILLSLTASAKKSAIKVISGDLSVFNNPDITATVVFDYTDLILEGKPYMEQLQSRGSDFVRDWPSESTQSEGFFVSCWNRDNEDGMQVTTQKGNQYTMVFVVKEMHMGSGAASMLVGFGAGGATMSGMMYILKDNKNVPVLTVSINGQSGRSGMTEIARRMDLYGELAEDMVDEMKDTKPSKVPASTKPVTIPSMKLNDTTVTVESAAKKTVQPAKVEQDVVKTTKAAVVSSDDRVNLLKRAKGKIIVGKRHQYAGNFAFVSLQQAVGVYLDFSKARILGHSEEDFIQYMQTSADDRDLDPNYAETWENKIKPDLIATFCGIVNDELSDDYSTRFVDGINYPYVLKLEVSDLDEDGNNIINFLFVNMETGEVEAQIKCESDGGRVGRYTGLLEQGFEVLVRTLWMN